MGEKTTIKVDGRSKFSDSILATCNLLAKEAGLGRRGEEDHHGEPAGEREEKRDSYKDSSVSPSECV